MAASLLPTPEHVEHLRQGLAEVVATASAEQVLALAESIELVKEVPIPRSSYLMTQTSLQPG